MLENYGDFIPPPCRVSACSFSLLLMMALTAIAADAEQKYPQHLDAALKMVEQLELSNTSYLHGAPDVRFVAPCHCHTDCSGFLDALLMHSYGYTPDQFTSWFGQKRPTADQWHDAIIQQKRFKQIHDFRRSAAGDILAVKYTNPKEKSTGHLMLMADFPKRIATTNPLKPNTEQWAVAVIDCARSGHGKMDTRHGQGPQGRDHDGLGKGELRVYTDSGNKLIGYTWSVGGKTFLGQPQVSIVSGRFEP